MTRKVGPQCRTVSRKRVWLLSGMGFRRRLGDAFHLQEVPPFITDVAAMSSTQTVTRV
jgi:hypothetical protein